MTWKLIDESIESMQFRGNKGTTITCNKTEMISRYAEYTHSYDKKKNKWKREYFPEPTVRAVRYISILHHDNSLTIDKREKKLLEWLAYHVTVPSNMEGESFDMYYLKNGECEPSNVCKDMTLSEVAHFIGAKVVYEGTTSNQSFRRLDLGGSTFRII